MHILIQNKFSSHTFFLSYQRSFLVFYITMACDCFKKFLLLTWFVYSSPVKDNTAHISGIQVNLTKTTQHKSGLVKRKNNPAFQQTL